MPRLKADVVDVKQLTPEVTGEMYRLLAKYFDDTSEALFHEDLANKDFVLLLRDEGGGIQGFSTGALMEAAGVRAYFTGDTIIDHEYWGEQTLPLAFAAQAARLKAAEPQTPLYWFLITKGYRTYRYLPLFFYDYYPRCDRPTPAGIQRLMDTLARARFGDAYDAAAGVIRFPESRGHLRGEWAEVREAMLGKADVRFFLERNPGFRRGDELTCLAELASDNIRPLARRVFDQVLSSHVSLV